MKRLSVVFLLFFIISCGDKDTTAEQTSAAAQTLDKETVFTLEADSLKPGCDSSSEIVCTINIAIKCSINPLFSECADNKQNMPSFIFMQDKTLQRPSFITYKITKLKPRSDGAVEVFTESSCNGNWFGLCNGNIIYVMKNINNQWQIIDIYALEF